MSMWKNTDNADPWTIPLETRTENGTEAVLEVVTVIEPNYGISETDENATDVFKRQILIL